MLLSICIAHLVNTRAVSEERFLFEPSRNIKRDERVKRDERGVNCSQYELSAVNSRECAYNIPFMCIFNCVS